MAAKKNTPQRRPLTTTRKPMPRPTPQRPGKVVAPKPGGENRPKDVNVLKSAESFQLLRWLGALIVLIAVWYAYSPTLTNEFTNWDDNSYVEKNALINDLSAETVKQMFFSDNVGYRYHMGNYHPMTMLSLAIDQHFTTDKLKEKASMRRIEREKRDARKQNRQIDKHWIKLNSEPRKYDPYLFQRNNLILHLLNTLLVFWLSLAISRDLEAVRRTLFSLIVMATWGLTTIHVESVTWISERKDVLHSFFFLLSLLSYLGFTDRGKKPSSWLFYLLSLLLFLFALLSKGQAVTLAVTIVAVDLLRKRNLLSGRVILEKIPFLAVALVFGLIAIKAQQAGNAMHDIAEYPFHNRLSFAAYGLVMYLVKFIYPYGLAAMYPYPYGSVPFWFYLFLLPAAAFGWLFIRAYRKNPLLAFGLAFFLLNISTQLQLIPVGSAIMADRYVYIPSVGLSICLGVLYLYVSKRTTSATPLVMLVLVAYGAFLSVKTYAQTQVWKDSIALWNNTLRISPHAIVAYNNRGSVYDKRGERDAAIEDFTAAVNLKKDYMHAYYNRGTSRKDMVVLNEMPERYQRITNPARLKAAKDSLLMLALADFDVAIGLDKNFSEAYHGRGTTREHLGNLKGALEDYNYALMLDSLQHGRYTQDALFSSRGVTKGKGGDLLGAIEDFNRSIEINPNNPQAYTNRGFAKIQLGQKPGNQLDTTLIRGGIDDYTISIQIDKDGTADARYNRGSAYLLLGENEKALSDFDKCVAEKPQIAMAHYNRAVILLRLNRKDEACNALKTAYAYGATQAAELISKLCQ